MGSCTARFLRAGEVGKDRRKRCGVLDGSGSRGVHVEGGGGGGGGGDVGVDLDDVAGECLFKVMERNRPKKPPLDVLGWLADVAAIALVSFCKRLGT